MIIKYHVVELVLSVIGQFIFHAFNHEKHPSNRPLYLIWHCVAEDRPVRSETI